MGTRLARQAAAFTVLVLAIAAAAHAAGKSLKLKSEQASSLNQAVLAAPNGHTLYRLKPETAKHLLCKDKTCFGFWPPLLVSSKSTTVKLPKGASGKVTFLKRGKKFQVMLKGMPLYMFGGDQKSGDATGQHVKSFGGEWFAITVKSSSASPPAPAQPQPTYPGY